MVPVHTTWSSTCADWINEHTVTEPQGTVVHESLAKTLLHHPHRHCNCCWFPQAGFSNLFRALLCELFQIQRAPASTAIELCFHYAGFLGSFKLIFILFSLLRPLKRAAFLPSLVNQGPSCSLGQRSAWWGLHGHTSPGLPTPGWGLPGHSSLGPWESQPCSRKLGQRPPGSDGNWAFCF